MYRQCRLFARRAAQKERVKTLYNWALKDTLNWVVHRHLFYSDADALREKFEANRYVRHEEDMLAQKKMPDGEKEEISQITWTTPTPCLRGNNSPLLFSNQTSTTFDAEVKKGFLSITDKDVYTFFVSLWVAGFVKDQYYTQQQYDDMRSEWGECIIYLLGWKTNMWNSFCFKPMVKYSFRPK